MTWQADGVKKVKERTYILGICMFCFSMLLFLRMFFLQVIEGQRYQTLADKNRISSRQIASDRGLIVDRNGENLASNRISFRAIITAEDTEGNVQNVLDNFRKIVPLDDSEMKRILKEIKQKRSFQPVRLKEDLSFEQMALVQLNIPELPGIAIEEGLMRVYPEKEKTAHIVGYVSFLSEEDLKEKNAFHVLPDVRIGRIGLERSFEKELAGVLGTRKMEINSIGREVRELEREEPIPGEDIQLSIDKRLQEIG